MYTSGLYKQKYNKTLKKSPEQTRLGSLTANDRLPVIDCQSQRSMIPSTPLATQEPAYRPPLVAGLVASVGGVDPHLARAATAAVHATCDALPGLWSALITDLVAAWSEHTRSSRWGAAFPRAAAQLLAGRMDSGSAEDVLPGACLQELAMLCRAESKGCRDVGRLLACGDLLCALVGAPACAAVALQGAVALLVSRFPKVGSKYHAFVFYY